MHIPSGTLVVNEIYGLSLIDTQDPSIAQDYPEQLPSYSFAQLMAEKQSPFLHLCHVQGLCHVWDAFWDRTLAQ